MPAYTRHGKFIINEKAGVVVYVYDRHSTGHGIEKGKKEVVRLHEGDAWDENLGKKVCFVYGLFTKERVRQLVKSYEKVVGKGTLGFDRLLNLVLLHYRKDIKRIEKIVASIPTTDQTKPKGE